MSEVQRSRCMSRIRGRDTGPELRLRRAIWALGLRYRLKSGLTGRPDLVFPTDRVVVFLDGCFWHGCARHLTWPRTNAAFWKRKITRNQRRDREVTARLQDDGWIVLRFWEHEIAQDLDRAVSRVLSALNRQRVPRET